MDSQTQSAGTTEYSLEHLSEAISFLGLVTPLLILGFKILYTLISDPMVETVPFLAEFSRSEIKGIPASWLVLITLMLHLIRLKFGIAFIKYDNSYLRAFEHVGDSGRLRAVNHLIILGLVVLSTALSVSIAGTYSKWIPAFILGLLALLIVIFDYLNRRYLFQLDTERKGNLLILVGDIAFFVFVAVALAFHISHAFGLKFEDLMVFYYALLAWSVLEITAIVLMVEVVFTYAQGMRVGIQRIRAVIGS